MNPPLYPMDALGPSLRPHHSTCFFDTCSRCSRAHHCRSSVMARSLTAVCARDGGGDRHGVCDCVVAQQHIGGIDCQVRPLACLSQHDTPSLSHTHALHIILPLAMHPHLISQSISVLIQISIDMCVVGTSNLACMEISLIAERRGVYVDVVCPTVTDP